MTKKNLLLSVAILCSGIMPAWLSAQSVWVENKVNPIGIDAKAPEFSWRIISGKRNVMQTAYEIRVSDNLNDLLKNKNIIWNSSKVLSDSSIHVSYKGNELQSNKKYYWQVRTWDNAGKTSAWSAPAFWQMGLLHTSDWKAKWIEPGYVEDSNMRPLLFLEKIFQLIKKLFQQLLTSRRMVYMKQQ